MKKARIYALLVAFNLGWHLLRKRGVAEQHPLRKNVCTLFPKLFLNRSAYRTYICAVATGDALVSVDNELAVTLRDAGSGATVCACATSDALVSNLECHW